jgi:hypothetical protein
VPGAERFGRFLKAGVTTRRQSDRPRIVERTEIRIAQQRRQDGVVILPLGGEAALARSPSPFD